jgi:16S rRNA (uracil1498-N3)-methyltransferase
MDHFYVDPKDIQGRTLVLRGDEQKHLVRVLRKKAGDRISATDGRDNSYNVVIRLLDRGFAECDILETFNRINEPDVDVTLAVSLLRNPARFDFLVEKVTELGVRGIVPLLCERTVPKHEKHSRLEKIALAALKQSGRSYLPTISPLTEFNEFARDADGYALRLIPHEGTDGSQFIGEVLKNHTHADSTLIAIGPEGGFSERELELARENEFIPVSLGPRRLRSETAAVLTVGWSVGGR